MPGTAAPVPAPSRDDADVHGKTAPVLVVDDNPVVRQGLGKVLTTAGFRVETAANGLEALVVIEKHPPAAVVCDIMMPVMDGLRLYERLSALAPAVARRIVFVTAWADDPSIRTFLQRTGQPVLQKPFEIRDLIQAVRELTARPD
jgi:two-component system NtrC family sensor kinase